MRLEFEKVRWCNLMSYGNVFTEIPLNQKRTTLIMGTNGAGKTTFLDAINLALYGKPFRPVPKKADVVNSIIGKQCLVEVEFRTPAHSYLVRRGIKPNLFEIIRDGTLIDQNSNSLDYQEMFETTILQMNQKSFAQMVVLGMANFVPFMRLSAQDRRKVIEDLLDIEIFSVMNGLLSKRRSENETELRVAHNSHQLITSNIEMQNKHIEELRKLNAGVIGDKKRELTKVTSERDKLKEDLTLLKKHHSELYTTGNRKWDVLNQELTKVQRYRAQVQANLEGIQRDSHAIDTTDVCRACGEPINQEKKQTQLSELLKEECRQKDLQIKIDARHKELLAELDKADKLRTECVQLSSRINADSSLLQRLSDQSYNLGVEIADMERKSKDSTDTMSLKGMQNELARLEDLRTELIDAKETINVAGVLLKDGGIKAKIIKQYIPVLNALINRYLEAFNFFVQFEIDEEFRESVRSRNWEDRGYESFSQGEKLRIDMSLLFAWREVARLRNSMSTNLFVLDEVLDGSLDAEGTTDFLQIVKSLTQDTNTFIISHRLENLEDFDGVIKVAKRGNFSELTLA